MYRVDQDTKPREGYAKLLEAWTPPRDGGEPVGCVATSFTFDALFFEEECLGRFLGIESDPQEDGAIYLIEREEKLAQTSCAAIVDGHHCRGERSLRWDLLAARIPGGVLHAKIAILRWSECVRILVASANLTESGYRLNQEVFAAIDFRPGVRAPIGVLDALVDLLSATLARHVASDSAAAGRVRAFLEQTRAVIGRWEIRPLSGLRVEAVIVQPGEASAIEQLAAICPSRAHSAVVVSPFYDAESEPGDAPSRALWDRVLRRRGEATLRYRVVAEEVPGEPAMLVHAPATLEAACPDQRPGCAVEFWRVTLPPDRPLHAKSVWLDTDRWALCMVGSSNFTTAGLGLHGARRTALASSSRGVNVEANLAYLLRSERGAKIRARLWRALPEAEPLSEDREVRWQACSAEGEDAPAADAVALSAGFGAAVYRWRDGVGELVLGFDAPGPGWTVHDETGAHELLDHSRWCAAGSPRVLVLPWARERPPSGLVVRIGTAGARAWWPVNVDAMASLAPPEALRDLPLDVLVEILTSARPLHRNLALRRHLRALEHSAGPAGDASIETDPLRAVDTSTYLLQRTRRVGWALSALRERLERPVPSEMALDWRLYGPVGVRAVAEAIVREVNSRATRSPVEQGFLIVELILELRRVAPRTAPGCLCVEQVRARLEAFADELRELLPATGRTGSPMLAAYVERALAQSADG